MKIEDGKTPDDILSGCAPIDWIKQVASDFKYAWNQTILDAKNLWKDFLYGVRGAWESASEVASQIWDNTLGWLMGRIRETPIVQATERAISYGIGIVTKAWNGLSDCTKSIIKGSAAIAGGAAVLAGGIWAIAAAAGAIGSCLLLQGAIVISAGLLWNKFVRGVRFLYNFNWNVSDSQIEQQYKAKLINLAGMAGEVSGVALGNLVCGYLPGQVMSTFNPVLAAKIKMAQPEIWEEAREEFESFLRISSQVGLGIWIADRYKNARKWVRIQAKGGKLPVPGKINDILKAWGEEGGKPWSFASAVNEKVEAIQNPFLQNFAEELLEGFDEGCDAGAMALI